MKYNLGLGKRITAFALAAILLATSTDYTVFADEIQADNRETVDATEVQDQSIDAAEPVTTDDVSVDDIEADNTDNSDDKKEVLNWHWNDDNQILVDGCLDIAYSGNEDDSLTWKEVRDELPKSITGTVDEAEQVIDINGWFGEGIDLTDETNLFSLGVDTLNLDAAVSDEYEIEDAKITIRFSCIETTASSNVKYEPLVVTSGYNVDIVATSSSPSSSEYYSKTAKMDITSNSGRSGACLYTSGVSSSSGYLPSDRKISSSRTSGLYWLMADYTKNNALKLTGKSAELKFSKIGVYEKLYFLCTAGGLGTGHTGTMNAKVEYTDGTYTSPTFSVRDWWDNENAATNKYKRYDGGKVDGSDSGAPYFTQCEMPVDSAKRIKSITVSGGSSSMIVCLFGVTGATADIAAPTNLECVSRDADSFKVSWSTVSGISKYAIDVATDENFDNTISGYNNKIVNANSCTIYGSGINPGTKYYVRIRAVNDKGSQSVSTAPLIVNTLSKMTIEYVKNSNDATGSMGSTTAIQNSTVKLADNSFSRTNYIFKDWNTKADGTGTSYTDGEQRSFNTSQTNSTLTLYAQWQYCGPVDLDNDGYAYGSAMSTSSVTLTTDVKSSNTKTVANYKWQMSSDKNNWTDISNEIASSDNSNSITLNSSDKLKDGYWYRCMVNRQTTTTPIQLVIANGSVMTNVTRPYTYRQWYVSNGYVAYTSTVSANGGSNFDVLGKFEKNGTYYWLQTSFSGGWRLYTSTAAAPTEANYYSDGCSLKSLRIAFDSTANFVMKFEAILQDSQNSFAFGCDTMLGNYTTSSRYSDYASLKAIKDGDAVKQIQMVGAYSVDTAKADDPSFVLKYNDAPTYYWLGRYYNRKVWTNSGSTDDVINIDSGMTSSWHNVKNVKFQFNVGAVSDTGAQITICAKSDTNSITIYNPDSKCTYALYEVTDSGKEEVSGWQALSGSSHKYTGLKPNTKYIIKAQNNGEVVSSEIYTKIDTNTGSTSGEKVTYKATSSSLKYDNVQSGRKYALEDKNGNRVTDYIDPTDNSVEFTGLRSGTKYYLVAKSGNNELSEKVEGTTLKAKITLDPNEGSFSTTPNALEKTYGVSVTIPSTALSRSDYTFAGWSTAKDGTAMYRAGSSYNREGDATLYAVWIKGTDVTIPSNEYSISYNANTTETVGSLPTTAKKKWGESYTLSTNIPTRTGCEFKEWNTSSDGKGTVYNPGEEYLSNDNLILYAVWTDKYQTITVEQSERYDCAVYDVKDDSTETIKVNGKVKYNNAAKLVFKAKDGFDFSDIQAFANGSTDALSGGVRSEDKRTYTIVIPNVTEDKYVSVSGVYPSSITVSKENLDFGSIIQHNNLPDAQTITVTNDGEKAVTINQPVSETSDSKFTLSSIAATTLESGDSTTFTVQPNDNITPGTDTEKIDVTTTTGIKKIVEVKFVVEKDETAPTGTITLKSATEDSNFAERSWDTLLDIANKAAYDIYYNSNVIVSLNAQDSGSGLDKVMYCLAKKGMTETELKALDDSEWKEYMNALTLEPYQTAVFYAKLTDKAGNVTYLSTEGIVLDNCGPVITDEDGNTVANGAVYTTTQQFTFDNSDSGKDAKTDTERIANDTLTVKVDGKEVTLTDGKYSFVPKNGAYHIEATDKAGNTTSINVTVNWKMIDVPAIESKVYTGETQTADIKDDDVYKVTKNDGGTDVGAYDVVLTLKDTVNNKWNSADGVTLSDDSIVSTSKFNITKAGNKFTTKPACESYTYNGKEAGASAESEFGEVSFTYYDKETDNKLEGAPTDAGSYYVIASVADCTNYADLTSDKIDFTISNASQDAPSDLEAVDETIDDKADGQIKNLTEVMQWRRKGASAGVSGENEYQDITATNMTFTDGTYEIRYAAKKNYNASEPAEITIKAGRMLKVDVPASDKQIGYEITTNNTSVSWNKSAVLTFKLKPGYSKLDNFAVKVNGEVIKLTAGENGTETYTLNNIEEDKNVTVEGVADITAPTGTVTVGSIDPWTEFLNKITFNRFFKETQNVTITADDAGSGVSEIAYYVYELTGDNTALTYEDMSNVKVDKWTSGSSIKVDPDKKFIIYAKLTDKDGNTSYISSDGIVLDNTAPVIDGIENNESYCENTVITVTDTNIDEVSYTVDGKKNVLETSENGKYTLPIGEITPLKDVKDVTVTAADKAGNKTEVTIKAEHDYSFEYVVPPTILDKGWTTHVCRRNGHQCGTTYNDTETDRLGESGLKKNDKSGLEKVNKDAQQRIDKNKYTDEKEKEFFQDIVNKSQDMLNDIKEAEQLKKAIDDINIPGIENPTDNDSEKLNNALNKINDLLDDKNQDTPTSSLTEEQKKQLEDLRSDIENKQNTIAQVKNDITFIERGDEKELGVFDINSRDNITPADQKEIEEVLDRIDDLLEKNGSNLTPEQKADMNKYHDQMMDKLKDAASQDIDNELADTKKQIESSITDTQKKEEALKNAEKAAEDAKNNISSSLTKSDLVDSREEGKLNLDSITGTEDDLKDAVKDNIERIFEDKKKEIEGMTDLTEDEKADALSKLQEDKDDAIKSLDNKKLKADIIKDFEELNKKFDDTIDKNLDKDLSNAKDNAKSDIDQKAEDTKKAIDSMPNLSDKEKEEAKAEVDKATDEAKSEIDKITDPSHKDNVSEKKDDADKALDQVETDATNNDISNMKEAAKSDIDSKADEAKDAIDQMEDLTPEQKADAKVEIDKKAEEAKKAVDDIKAPTNKDDVENIRKDIESKKTDVSADIEKKQEESSATNDTIAKENVKKAEEAVKKAETVIGDIKISSTDETAIKEEVKSELNKSSIDDADVTVSDLNKTPAKLHEKGKITGTVEIKVGSTTKTIEIDQDLPELSTFVNYDSKVEDDAPKSDVSIDVNKLMDNVLSDDNIDALEKGSKADILLHIKNKDMDAVGKDKDLIEDVLTDNEQIGKYLDISLLLNITDSDGNKVVEDQKISEAKTMFTITVSIPEELVASGNVIRTYQIVRVHNGIAELLDFEYDEDAQTLTFATDRFSTYAITYSDTVKQIDKPSGDNKPTTGDSSNGGNSNAANQPAQQPATPSVKADTTKKAGTKTGDNNTALPFVMLMFAGVGLAAFGRKKKVNR